MTTPKLYVSTYHKYNSGTLKGAWVELEGHDIDSFLDTIRELHSDESDPEYMFQDYEGIPKSLYSESGNLEKIFEYLEFLEHTHLSNEIIEAGIYLGVPIESLEDAYQGHYASAADFAEEYVESTGMLSDVPDFITYHIDYESMGRDLTMDYCEHNGHYFNTDW